MIRKYEPINPLIKEYAESVIGDKSRLRYNYREDVYNDFLEHNPGCNITSHYFTRHINLIFNTTIKLVSIGGKQVYIFVDNKNKENNDTCTISRHNR